MYVKYVCDPGCLKPAPGEGVIRIDVEGQIELLCDFFGVDMPPEDRAQIAAQNRSGLEEDYGVLVQGRLVARALIINNPPEPVEIMNVYVKPEHRGSGYAKRLVSRCAEVLLARGIRPMGITGEENAPMRAVFEALGFRGAPWSPGE